MKKIRNILIAVAVMVCAIVATTSQKAYAQVDQISTLSADTSDYISKPFLEAVKWYFEGVEPKIIGGKEVADIKDYPWQVSLGVSWIIDPYYAHFCGGSIYNEKWIITAAHCVIGLKTTDIVITAGTAKLGDNNSQRRNIKTIIVHQGYNKNTFDNDIALIEVVKPFVFSESVKNIPLLSSQDESRLLTEDAQLVVLGWGYLKEGGTTVRDLRYLDNLPYVERADCNSQQSYDGMITNNMICAGSMGIDACQGDSGGPLDIDDNEVAKLSGIVSWGIGCGRPNKPGVYTRVSNYTEWIKSQVVAFTPVRNRDN